MGLASAGQHAGSPLRRIDLELSWSEARSARARAHEARQPAAPVPGQVHPAARRDAPRAVRAGRRPCARPVRGLGHDARAGARARPRRDRRRHRRRSTRCSCGSRPALQPLHARARAPLAPARASRRSSRSGRVPAGDAGLRPALVRAGGGRPAARVSGRSWTRYEHADVLAGRAGARRALGPPNDPLRPRLPTHASDRAVLVLQAPARVQAGEARDHFLLPLHARHARHASMRSPGPRASDGSRACCTATPGRSSSSGRYDGVITSPPYPGLIDYHEQHRYAYELLDLDDGATSSSGGCARHGAGRDRGVRRRRRPLLRTPAASLVPGARMCIVVNDRRDLYPEILQRAGLRLVDRHDRHVNRRTGRRAGEYFESILVAVAR